MSTGCWRLEVESLVDAGRMFKAAVLEWHKLGPKIAPEAILSAALLCREGGVGSGSMVREFNFTSVMPYRYLKDRVDFVDHDKIECTCNLIEGGSLGKKLQSCSSHFKFEQASSGGCVINVSVTFRTIPGILAYDFNECKSREVVLCHLKAVEAYLLANPDAFT